MSHRHTPESFWTRIWVSDPDKCWIWKLRTVHNGYGSLTYQGKTWKAHRLAYTIAKGPIPSGMLVRHTCDNPPCCNPAHLLLGTNLLNSADMVARNRTNPNRGESTGHALLSASDIPYIWQLRAEGHTYAHIAEIFNVSPTTIQDVIYMRSWSHISSTLPVVVCTK